MVHVHVMYLLRLHGTRHDSERKICFYHAQDFFANVSKDVLLCLCGGTLKHQPPPLTLEIGGVDPIMVRVHRSHIK
jgi:hypothetical protein